MQSVFVNLRNKRIEKGISITKMSKIADVDYYEIINFESGAINKINNRLLLLVDVYSRELDIELDKLLLDIKNDCKFNVLGEYVKRGLFIVNTPSLWLVICSLVVAFFVNNMDTSFLEKKSKTENLN